jgi:NAD(P)-dependent dehydrogenase (short-subunit alcohol dehydrogenase family)
MAGRRVLVTGGSLGIGRAIVTLVGTLGASVAIQRLSTLDADLGYAGSADELARSIEARGGRSTVVEADFGRPGEARAAVRQAEAAIGPLDTVFVCASTQKRESFDAVTLENAMTQFLVNYWSTVELLQEVLPGMKARGFGRIVSIGSSNQERPEPDLAVYASLKAAQHNLIVNLAKVHVGDGLTFNTVSPGLIATPRNDWRRRESMVEWRAFEAKANPMHRAGRPEEVAQIAVALVREGAAFVTGINVGIDGGVNL